MRRMKSDAIPSRNLPQSSVYRSPSAKRKEATLKREMRVARRNICTSMQEPSTIPANGVQIPVSVELPASLAVPNSVPLHDSMVDAEPSVNMQETSIIPENDIQVPLTGQLSASSATANPVPLEDSTVHVGPPMTVDRGIQVPSSKS